MGYLIDTSTLIRLEKAKISNHFLKDLEDSTILGVSAITASELLHGVHRAKEASMKAKRSAFVEGVLETLTLYPFDLKAARAHAEIWALLATQKIVISAHDLLIGATALSLGFGVVTANPKDFERIPGLSVKIVG